MKRWPILSERNPEHLTSARVRSLTTEVIQKWTNTVGCLKSISLQALQKKILMMQQNESGTVMKQLLPLKPLHERFLPKRVLEVCMRLGVEVEGSI